MIDAIKPLENVPEEQKDWHPRSDGKVLDLVHPSIYPLVYGQTIILPEEKTSLEDWHRHFGVGDELQPDQDVCDLKEWSNRFQWLPCDVDISGDKVKIVSYINNLHPQRHRKLYSVIEQAIEKSIPLWNETLSRLLDYKTPRIEFDHNGYGETTEPEPEFPKGDDPDYEAFEEEYGAWQDTRPIVQPEPKTFQPGEDKEGIVFDDLRSRTAFPDHKIQVIVKLASIYLTPNSPNYDGGSWHVEGAANENICASAIYYYESENISESLLSFRQHVKDTDLDMNYEQDEPPRHGNDLRLRESGCPNSKSRQCSHSSKPPDNFPQYYAASGQPLSSRGPIQAWPSQDPRFVPG